MRTLSTLISFFIILGLYFLYGWVIAPLVLPSPEELAQGGFPITENRIPEEIEPFLFLFPENSWERDPKTEIHYLQFGQTIVLFGKDESNGNIVKLQPCTILMIQGLDDPNITDMERKEQIRQAVVMRTPLYAEIEFDREFNFSQTSLPEIKGGKLVGKVTIESAMKEPGLQDDFFLETENVSITETPGMTRIETLKDVRFYSGYNNGEGSMFSMELTPSNPKIPKSPKTLSLVRFEKLKQLHLVFPDDPKLEPKRLDGNSNSRSSIVPAGTATSIDIKCQREFLFQSLPAEKAWVARFFGNADVVRTNPDGSTDNLTAEEVHVKFQSKESPQTIAKSAAKPAVKSTDPSQNIGFNHLEPVSFEANGRLQPPTPAKLSSQQSGGVLMVGDHLLYDIQKNLLVIETQTLPGASKEVEMVFQNKYFIRGEKSFQYTIGQNNEFGKLVSNGKGNLRGNLGDEKTPKKLFLSWNALSAEPSPMVKNQIILKLWGGILADWDGFGKMTAGKINLWCNVEPQQPKPAASANTKNSDPKIIVSNTQEPPNKNSADKNSLPNNKNNITPDHAVVIDNVRFLNEKGTCDVNRLYLFFKTISPNGNVTVSRWLPRVLTELPPSPPVDPLQQYYQPVQQPNPRPVDSSYLVSNIPSDWQNDLMIQRVQHQQPASQPATNLQPLQSPQTLRTQQTETGMVPLYQTQPAPLVGTASSIPKTNIVANTTAPNSVASQSLPGIQPNGSMLQYAVVGKQMSMQITDDGNRSIVEMLAVEGDVKVTEKVDLINVSNNAPNAIPNAVPNSDVVQITGEEVTVWNPSTPKTQILISGKQKDAVFQGRGVVLRGKEINLSRSNNKIWVPGVGRLIANTESGNKYFQTKNSPASVTVTASNPQPNGLTPLVPLKTTTISNKDNRLFVEWNESMIFDGNVLLFLGKSGRDSNRVWTIYQDKQIWCDVMEVRLNRVVSLFDDKSDVQPEAEMIQCANNVIIESREYDDKNHLKSQDSAEFGKFRFWVKQNFFVAEGPNDSPGVLRMTHFSSDKGFNDSKMNLPEIVTNTNGGNGLTFLAVWFHDQIQGTLLGDQREVTISGRVQTAYTPVDSWEDKIGINNINAARRRGYILECEKLHIVEMPDPNNENKNSIELTAVENASIDGSKFYGKAKTIKYNQSKTLVTFDGAAKIHSFDAGKKGEQAAETIQYNIETKAIRINQSSGMSFGQ